MRKIKIWKRIFFNNEYKVSFLTKMVLYRNYTQNLKRIKNNFYPDYVSIIVNIIKGQNNNNNKNIQNNLEDNKFPNFKYELREIKIKKIKKKLNIFYVLFSKIKKLINIKSLLDLKHTQDNIQKIFSWVSRHIEIYKKSIQEIVEGQREVTTNKNFKFEDGKTVQEKMDNFENKIKENLNLQNFYNKIKK